MGSILRLTPKMYRAMKVEDTALLDLVTSGPSGVKGHTRTSCETQHSRNDCVQNCKHL